jgi:hypothetical protein
MPKRRRRKKSANEWVSDMLGISTPEVIPPGWITMEAMAEAAGMPMRTAANRAVTLIRQGKLERRQFRVKVEGRGMAKVWHYHPVQKEI